MVASATRRLSHPWRVRRLRHLGRISKRALHIWPVSLALLFAGDLGRFPARVAGAEAGVVARPSAVLAGAPDPSISRPVSIYLLLLSRGVLQGVLGGSAELRGRRAEKELHRGACISAHRAEHPSLLPLRRG